MDMQMDTTCKLGRVKETSDGRRRLKMEQSKVLKKTNLKRRQSNDYTVDFSIKTENPTHNNLTHQKTNLIGLTL
jgi:hypothetical protein